MVPTRWRCGGGACGAVHAGLSAGVPGLPSWRPRTLLASGSGLHCLFRRPRSTKTKWASLIGAYVWGFFGKYVALFPVPVFCLRKGERLPYSRIVWATELAVPVQKKNVGPLYKS